MDLATHDWPAVLEALQDLLTASRDDEPDAINFHAALQDVIAGLPQAAFE